MDEQNKIKTSAQSAPTVETFTDDMVKVIEDDKGGLIKKIIKEQEAHETEEKNMSPESKRNRVFVLVGLILILLAVALLAFLFFKINSQTIPLVTVTTPQQAPLIFADKTVPEDVGGLDAGAIAHTISSEVQNSNIASGDIEAIAPVANGKPVGLRSFIGLLKSSFDPGDPDLVSDNFLMGIVGGATVATQATSTSDNNFFILIKMRSFVDIFPAMRAWESTMFSDLDGLFGGQVSATSDLPTKAFQDGIVQNKNARILYDDNNNIALMYVFADDQSVIIANNQDVVKAVILRLGSSQQAQ